MEAKLKRALRSSARQLKARVMVGKAGLTEPLIGIIRRSFDGTELVKVRILPAHIEEAETICQRIAQEVPCELIDRTGFVATFYRAAIGGTEASPL
jgi:RNA-binding protein YhbY